MGVIARLAAAFVLLTAHAAHADGPALAFVTLEGRTLTLSAQNAPFQPPMIRADGQALHLTFADLRLGFPLPPTLNLRLIDTPEGWLVTGFQLDMAPEIYMNNTGQILEIQFDQGELLSLSLITEALAPAQPVGTALVQVLIEITMRSP